VVGWEDVSGIVVFFVVFAVPIKSMTTTANANRNNATKNHGK
jgi:hypothetical protein